MAGRLDPANVAPYAVLIGLTVALVLALMTREWGLAAGIVVGWCGRSAFR